MKNFAVIVYTTDAPPKTYTRVFGLAHGRGEQLTTFGLETRFGFVIIHNVVKLEVLPGVSDEIEIERVPGSAGSVAGGTPEGDRRE